MTAANTIATTANTTERFLRIVQKSDREDGGGVPANLEQCIRCPVMHKPDNRQKHRLLDPPPHFALEDKILLTELGLQILLLPQDDAEMQDRH